MAILIISLVIFSLVASIWLVNKGISTRNTANEQSRSVRQFHHLASNLELDIRNPEIHPAFILGIDNNQQKLLIFRRKKMGTGISKLLDLNALKYCSVVRYYQPYRGKNQKSAAPLQLLEKIVLLIIMHDGSKEEIQFYDHNRDGVLVVTQFAMKAAHWENQLSRFRFQEKEIA